MKRMATVPMQHPDAAVAKTASRASFKFIGVSLVLPERYTCVRSVWFSHTFVMQAVQATARAMAQRCHNECSAVARWSMSASVWQGEGVMRSRSVPRGTVG